jgi:hypothetical protein
MRDVAFVALDPFLVATELVLNLVNALVHRRLGCGPDFSGYKIMLVLGRNQDLHVPGLFALIDSDLNGHQTIEIFEQLFGLIVQVTLLLGTQTTVARCDLDLHPCAPCMIVLPAPLLAKLAIIKNYPLPVHSVKTTPTRSFGRSDLHT